MYEIARKENEILVEWLESKDTGERNCVNVKHIIGDTGSIATGETVLVKFNLRCYKVIVINLLDWTVSSVVRRRSLVSRHLRVAFVDCAALCLG